MTKDWGEKIQKYQDIKTSDPDAVKFRNPLNMAKQVFESLGVEGIAAIFLISLIIFILFKNKGWLN